MRIIKLKDKTNIKKFKFIDNEEIIYTNKGKYIVKVRRNDIKSIYEYLINRNFTNFIKLENYYDEPYEIYRYIEDDIKDSDKAIDLVYILSILHNKTTTYQEVNIDKVKNIYESFNKELDSINNYYLKLQDDIEQKVYMAPAEYLLIRNISKIYKSIDHAKHNISKWYEIKSKKKNERTVLIHNNVKLKNFIDKEKCLKNWDYAKRDYAAYDFYNFYKNDYQFLEFNSLFNIYQSKYKYTEDEYLLLTSLIYRPWKIELINSNYDNCIKVRELLDYIEKPKAFSLENNHKKQETNNNKLNK